MLKIGQRPEHDFGEPLGLLSDCHRRIEHFLAVLATITGQVDGQALNAAQRSQFQSALTYFSVAAPKHIADKEESVFPRLSVSEHPDAKAALDIVRRLERDHDEANAHHHAVNELGQKWLVDDHLERGAVRELRQHLDRLQLLYRSHIAVEDYQLFPAAARILSATDLESIGHEMATRRSVR